MESLLETVIVLVVPDTVRSSGFRFVRTLIRVRPLLDGLLSVVGLTGLLLVYCAGATFSFEVLFAISSNVVLTTSILLSSIVGDVVSTGAAVDCVNALLLLNRLLFRITFSLLVGSLVGSGSVDLFRVRLYDLLESDPSLCSSGLVLLVSELTPDGLLLGLIRENSCGGISSFRLEARGLKVGADCVSSALSCDDGADGANNLLPARGEPSS